MGLSFDKDYASSYSSGRELFHLDFILNVWGP